MNKRILMYFDNQLPVQEQKELEAEIEKSPELQQEFLEARKLFATFKVLNTHADMSDYYAESRVRFNENSKKSKAFSFVKKPVAAFSAAGAFLTILIVSVILLRQSSVPTFESQLNEIAPEVAIAYMQATPAEAEMVKSELIKAESDELLDEALVQEIGITGDNASVIMDNLNLSSDELFSSLTQEEVEELSKKLEN